MAVAIRAESLDSLYRLADDPPKFFRRVSEQDRSALKLYITRVPGGQDLILTTFKPRQASVTAEDITSCLYYLRVQTTQPTTSNAFNNENENSPPPPPPKDQGYGRNAAAAHVGGGSSSNLSAGNTNRERWSISNDSGTNLYQTSSARTSRSCSPPKRSQPPPQEFSITVIRRDISAGTQQVVGQIMTANECERRSKAPVRDARQARRDRHQLMLEIWNKGYDKFLPQQFAAAPAPAPAPARRAQAPPALSNVTRARPVPQALRSPQSPEFPLSPQSLQSLQSPQSPPILPPPPTSQVPPASQLPPSLRAGLPLSRDSPISPPSPPPPPPPHLQAIGADALRMPSERTYIPPRKPIGASGGRVTYPGFVSDDDDTSLKSPPLLPPPPPSEQQPAPAPAIPNPHLMRMEPKKRLQNAAAPVNENLLYVSKFTEIYSPDTPVEARNPPPWETQDPEVFRRVLALEGEGFWKVTGSRLATAIANHKRSKSSADVLTDQQLEEETRRAMAEMGIQTRPPITSSHSEQPPHQPQPGEVRQKGYVFDAPNKGSGRCEFESHSGGRRIKLKFRPAYHAADPYSKKPESISLCTISFQSPDAPSSSRSGGSTPGSSSYGARSRSPSPVRGHGHHSNPFKAKFHDKFKPKFKRQGSWTEQEEFAAGMGLKSKLGSLTIESEGLDMLDLVVASSMGVFLKKAKDWQDLRSNIWTLR